MHLETLEKNLSETKKKIAKACDDAGKNKDEIALIGVTKRQSIETIRQAYEAGIKNLAENYVQEALEKMDRLKQLDIIWHYIGAIQSNKTRQIAENFTWIHSVSSLKIARLLSKHCPANKKLNLLIQINVDSDPDKLGIPAVDAGSTISEIAHLPNILIRGMMVILSKSTNPKTGYEKASGIFKELSLLQSPEKNIYWDTLSMGMSKDYYEAILSGGNAIRLGTTLFGERAP